MSAYHDILGVRPEASQEEIKAAFRKRALECHPDRAADGEKEEAQEEFVRVREAFEILCDEEDRRAPRRTEPKSAPDADDPSRARGPRQSYKERWRNAKKVRVSKDIVDRVGGLSEEYNLIREKNKITVPLCALVVALVYIADPMTLSGSGVFLVDVVLSGLVGSAYGLALGSVWAYAKMFIGESG
jgi:hypothetical protein